MKKGFTLVELLAVVVILGLIAIIAIPSYINIINSKSNELYNMTISQVISSAKTYMVNNPKLYSIETIDNNHKCAGISTYCVKISIDDLCNADLIECPITDPRDRSTLNGSVVVTLDNDKLVYEYINS